MTSRSLTTTAIILIMLLAGMTFSMEAFAGEQVLKDQITIREWLKNRTVEFDVPAGDMIAFANDEACGKTEHRTKDQGLYFEHIHIKYTLPKTGMDEYGVERTVTTDKIDAYWDWHYGPIDGGCNPTKNCTGRDSGANHTYNCYAYAFGYDTWIQDPTYIFQDDYQGNVEVDAGVVQKLTGHVIKVTSKCTTCGCTVCPNSKFNREKNNASGIYFTIFRCPTGGMPYGTSPNYYKPNPPGH